MPSTESFKRASRELGPAFRTALPYLSFGLILGGFILLIHFLLITLWGLPEASIEARMLEHLGVAFLVSSIAVFGYEWSGHINTTLGAGDRLRDELSRVHLIVQAVGREGIERCLDGALTAGDDGPHVAAFKKNIVRLMDVAVKLNGPEIIKRSSRNYFPFVSLMLEELVVENAQKLAELARGRVDTEYHVKLAWKIHEFAARLLVAQMQSMEIKDEYRVVSDVILGRETP